MAGKRLQKTLSEFPTNRENPYIEEALEQIAPHFVRKYVNSSGPDRKAVLNMVDGETGEVLQTRFVRQIKVDNDTFVKLYLINFEQFFDLSKSAIRVFGYLMTCLKPAKDMVVFNLEDAKTFTKYSSKQTIYNALAELVGAKIIARGWSDVIFFINPMIAFNGSRVQWFTEYINQDAEAAKAAEAKRHEEERKEIAEGIAQIEMTSQE